MNAQILTLLRGSLANRAFSLGLIVVTLACAVALYVGVQNVQRLTRASFENSISGVDLVVAARGSARSSASSSCSERALWREWIM